MVPSSRALPIDEKLGEQGVLLALAATAYHAIHAEGARQPDLIVGHGVLGRLSCPPGAVVRWSGGGVGAQPHPRRGRHPLSRARSLRKIPATTTTPFTTSAAIPTILDTLISRLAPCGEIVLAGFYEEPLKFNFPPAFLREARIRVAAEWRPEDLVAVKQLVESGRLSLDGLITHREEAQNATEAYRTAFNDPTCLKMVLDWRTCS